MNQALPRPHPIDHRSSIIGSSDHRFGFTLIELAIVLAIIGVLVGAVMEGQYLVRQAQVNSIVTDLAKFHGAYFKFKQQYGGLPGDIVDATDYWGTDPNGCPTSAVYTPRKETCNGDGDGTINTGTYPENFHAWQQLSDAGLIDGTFWGVTGPNGTRDAQVGGDIPAGKISNTGYYMFTIGPYTGDSSTLYYDVVQAVVILYGLKHPTAWTYDPALTAREQYNIDLKMDDGAPSVGNTRSQKSVYNPSCTTSDVSGSATYNLTSSGALCSVLYLVDY